MIFSSFAGGNIKLYNTIALVKLVLELRNTVSYDYYIRTKRIQPKSPLQSRRNIPGKHQKDVCNLIWSFVELPQKGAQLYSALCTQQILRIAANVKKTLSNVE